MDGLVLGSVLSPSQLTACYTWYCCCTAFVHLWLERGGGQALVGDFVDTRLRWSHHDNLSFQEPRRILSSTSGWRHPSPCSSSTSRPSWEGVAGEGEQEKGAGCSHSLPHGAPGSAAHLQACPGHESSTQAIRESLPEIDGTCHIQRAISNYTAPNTSSKMQGL